MRHWRAFTVVAAIGLSACATEAPSIPNPDGLAPDALSLGYILDRGCMPFIRGEMSEQAAMRGVGLTKVAVLSFPDPPPPPHWIGHYPGVSVVNVSEGLCAIHVIGRNAADYQRATIKVLHDRLGADADRDAGSAAYRTIVPGQVAGCAQGIRYTYYPSPPGLSPGWDVELQRGC